MWDSGRKISRRHLVRQAAWLGAAGVTGLFGPDGRAAEPAPDRIARVGYLGVTAPIRGFSSGRVIDELARLGYIESRNLVFEVRHADGHPERLPQAAAELVALRPDVILAVTNPAIFAAKAATATIPIVAWGAHGAVETGLVSNLRRPGGNVTGIETLAVELDAKRVQMLRQILPDLKRLTVLMDVNDQGSPHHLSNVQKIGGVSGLSIHRFEIARSEDFDPLFAARPGKALGVLMPFTSNLMFRNWTRIRDFAVDQRLPTLCEFRSMTETGCLLSYGPTFDEINQRCAVQIDKILRGALPGELPIEQPTRFELIINLKTARSLGLTVPQELLLRADAVIE